MLKNFVFLILLITFSLCEAQNEDSLAIRKIYDEALSSHIAYKNLEYLSLQIGSRLSGSQQLADAIKYTRQLMQNMDLDSIYLQEVKIPHWVRGEKEVCKVQSNSGTIELDNCALGGSVGTGGMGLTSKVLEVSSFEQLSLSQVSDEEDPDLGRPIRCRHVSVAVQKSTQFVARSFFLPKSRPSQPNGQGGVCSLETRVRCPAKGRQCLLKRLWLRKH